MADALFRDARSVLVGRDHLCREVAFDQLGRTPELGGIALEWLGPVSVRALHSLTREAVDAARGRGYPPDMFAMAGLGTDRLVALVPAEAPESRTDVGRLATLLGLPEGAYPLI